jgi:Mg/Co/Ni transporter MgtE
MASPRTETGAPTTKVIGGTVGAAFATLIIWILTVAGLTVDAGVKVALTTVITFAVGYMIPPAPRDNVVQ